MFYYADRALVTAALLIVSFSVFETYSNHQEPSPVLPQQPFDAIDPVDAPESLSLADTLDLFESRRIFGPPPDEEVMQERESEVVRGWRGEVRDYWRLKGSSVISGAGEDVVLEAIVFDGRSQRLQFLRAGEIIRIADQDVGVARVEEDRIELRREDEILVLD